MPITLAQLSAIMPHAGPRSQAFLDPLNAAMDRFEVSTPNRQALFLAQVAHESGELRWLREIWGPTPAQLGYEGRADLGNTQPGDGKRFMGRGLLQITGRAAYALASGPLYGDDRLLSEPQVLEAVEDACMCAGWVWGAWKNLNPVADAGDAGALLATTRRINGGTNGLISRQSYWLAARAALGIDS